jgi:hypothetical protein
MLCPWNTQNRPQIRGRKIGKKKSSKAGVQHQRLFLNLEVSKNTNCPIILSQVCCCHPERSPKGAVEGPAVALALALAFPSTIPAWNLFFKTASHNKKRVPHVSNHPNDEDLSLGWFETWVSFGLLRRTLTKIPAGNLPCAPYSDGKPLPQIVMKASRHSERKSHRGYRFPSPPRDERPASYIPGRSDRQQRIQPGLKSWT